ncbi:MAG: amidophosphoribosyltransferase [Erysipelotrichaceae bacterium]
MGGFFGVASKNNSVVDLYFGIDYHSHLGTKKAGMAVYGLDGFQRSIHNISNTPFRTKFESEVESFSGPLGIGCISDSEPQPLLVSSHLGSFAVTTVGRINNMKELVDTCFSYGTTHFLEMSGGEINPTELVVALINQKESILAGLTHVQNMIKGSMSVLVMDDNGIYCARDKYGRTPVIIAQKDDACCVTFESSAFLNLGYKHLKDLGPGEIVKMRNNGIEELQGPNKKMKMCSFLWVYYGYPSSEYEGKNVEIMRNNCGKMLAKRDRTDIDLVAGVPDSGIAHAIGYANEAHLPYGRPFIKYTPTWPRSFMPSSQIDRSLIAKMKLIPITELIDDKKLLLIDDSIVRGTQLKDTTDFLYNSGAKEVHVRPACPPLIFGCKYLNFSRSSSEMELITRKVIAKLENSNSIDLDSLKEYANPNSSKYQAMVDEMCKRLKVTSLDFVRVDELVESIGLPKCDLCTYCWTGEE